MSAKGGADKHDYAFLMKSNVSFFGNITSLCIGVCSPPGSGAGKKPEFSHNTENTPATSSLKLDNSPEGP